MEGFGLWGTLVNAVAVILGALIGLVVHKFMKNAKSEKKTESLSDCVFAGLALCVMMIGITGAIAVQSDDMLIVIFSVVLGAVIGHLCNIDGALNRLGERVEAMTKHSGGSVARGFVSASLLFCVGSMAIVGSLQSGLGGGHATLYAKSLIDFFSAIVLAISMGFGVLLSFIPVFVYQGAITLLAQWVSPVLSADVIRCMSVVGSLLIIGLSLNMLNVTKIKVANYLPAIILPALLIPLVNLVIRFFA